MKLLLALAFVGFAATARAQATLTQTAPATVQAAASGTTRVQFKTSAVCDMCKARIEKSLIHEKGVQSAVLDVSTKVLTVTYKSDDTTPAALRIAVQKIGYDANEFTADARAFNRLPDCCKKSSPTPQTTD